MAPSGVNDAAREVMAAVRRQQNDAQWFNWGHVPVQQTSKSFLVSTTATHVYTAGRRVKLFDGGVTIISTVEASSPTGSNTLISITGSSGVTSSLSSAYVGILDYSQRGFDPMRLRSESVSTSYLISFDDLGKIIEVDAAAGGRTATLPGIAVNAGNNIIAVVKNDSSANVVTVATSDSINNRAQEELVRQWDSILLRGGAGPRWHVLAYRKTFISSEISITGAAVYSTSHNGGTIPFWWGAFLRNTTPELGYSAGDEIHFGNTDTDATGAFDVLAGNGTTLYLIHNRAAWAISRRDTGASANLTTGSWRLVFKARWEL